MKRLLPILMFSILVICTLIFGQDFRPPGPRPDRPPRPRGELRERLELIGLTSEQRENMENLRSDLQKKIIPVRAQIELKQIDLRKAMKNDQPSEAVILKLAREIHDLEFQIKELEIKQKIAFHSMLTAEQRKQLREPIPPAGDKED